MRRKALRRLAEDIGAPSGWADTVWKAEEDARDCHGVGWSLGRAALVGVGLVAIVAAPMLVVAVAPAGLAGGAAITAGLAALGPGGMAGGLAVVSAVGVGGGVVAVQGLSAGSAQAVEENVIAIQALALAFDRLDIGPTDRAHWFLLVAMEGTVEDEIRPLRGVSDAKGAHVKQLTTKLKVIRKALDWMVARGLGPKQIGDADEKLMLEQGPE